MSAAGDVNDAVGPNRPTVLSEHAIEVLALVLSALRKSKDAEERKVDMEDTHDVLLALTISGYAVLPQGTIEAIKRLLTEYQTLPKARA